MLTTPRLKIFNTSMDAANIITCAFDSTGGDMPYANELEVYNVDTNAKIYGNKITTFQFKHDILGGTLTNGTLYKVRVKTYNSKGEYSNWSDFIFLRCLSIPVITLNNLGDGVIESQSYKFTGEYSQSENDALKSYKFVLYDFQKRQIAISDELFSQIIEYEFGGLENDANYYVEIKVKSVNGGDATTGLQPIYVKYLIPRMANVLSLDNNFENGCVDIEIKAIQVRFQLSDGSYEYINDEWINIDGCIYTDSELGFYLDSEMWTFNIRFKLSPTSSEILKIYGENDDCLTIEKWQDRLFVRYYKNGLLMMNRWFDISLITSDTVINLWIRKEENGISDKITFI